MGRLRKETQPWMHELAAKYNISVETVEGLYHSFCGIRLESITRKYMDRKKRTEEFLQLYFEEVNHG